MKDYEALLTSSVFYPCSHLDGKPIALLAEEGFTVFLYVDYSLRRTEVIEKGVDLRLNHRRISIHDLEPRELLGQSWSSFAKKYSDTITRTDFPWKDPFLLHETLEITTSTNTSQRIDFIFVCSEGLAAYQAIYHSRSIAPRCLAHIRSGIGMGGNFQLYPRELDRVLVENPGGLPEYLLYDDMGSNPHFGDYLGLVEAYMPVRTDRVEDYTYRNNVSLTFARRASDTSVDLQRIYDAAESARNKAAAVRAEQLLQDCFRDALKNGYPRRENDGTCRWYFNEQSFMLDDEARERSKRIGYWGLFEKRKKELELFTVEDQ
jgi:hypothetical protein